MRPEPVLDIIKARACDLIQSWASTARCSGRVLLEGVSQDFLQNLTFAEAFFDLI